MYIALQTIGGGRKVSVGNCDFESVTYGNDINTTPGMKKELPSFPCPGSTIPSRASETVRYYFAPLARVAVPEAGQAFPRSDPRVKRDTYHRTCDRRQKGPSTKRRHEAPTPGLGRLPSPPPTHTHGGRAGGLRTEATTSSLPYLCRGHPRGWAAGRRWGTGPRDDSLFQ